MVKLANMPAQAIISGFKGSVDFYYWMGIPVARSWPRSPGPHRAPGVEEQWSAFTIAAQGWSTLTPEVQQTYIAIAQNSGLSGRDMFTRAYLSGLYRLPSGAP